MGLPGKKVSFLGARVVAQHLKPPLATWTSHTRMPVWFLVPLSTQRLTEVPEKATDGGLRVWSLATYEGGQDEVPGSWIWPGSVVVSIWGNERVDKKYRCLFFPLSHSAFQISKWTDEYILNSFPLVLSLWKEVGAVIFFRSLHFNTFRFVGNPKIPLLNF